MFGFIKRIIDCIAGKDVPVPKPEPTAWSHIHEDIVVFNGVKPLQYIEKYGTREQYNAAKRAANAGNGRLVREIAARVSRNK